ncbi:MAG: AAA family ATPase [Planctomycetes bacterium]|nr:AAA family ATPase [Planctomycetota bacterium]
MLRRLALKNFKSFADEQVTLAPFTLLVGANASGKSNFLDALRFLHGIAQGWPIRDVVAGRFEGSTKVWQGIRGGTGELVRSGAATASITSDWHNLGDRYHHEIEFDGTTILGESLGNFFEASRSTSGPTGDDQAVKWLPGASPTMVGSHEFSEAGKSALASPQASRIPLIGPFRATLGHIHFADQSPALMREYVEKPRGAARVRPSSSGHNLSSVLWQLCQEAKSHREIVDWLVEFCAPEIADIEFEETDSGYVMLRVVEADGTKITARSMSDGTLRFLSLLATLRSPIQTQVFEDLELGLHPSRLRLLVEFLASRTEPQMPAGNHPVVIATTHSAALVEAALDVPHCEVLLFARVPGTPGTVIRNVRSLPNFDEVHRRRDFAYLLNTGWLERSV